MLQAEGFAAHCLREPVQRAEWLESVREAFSKSTPMRAQLATQPCVRQMLESLTPHEREVLDLVVTDDRRRPLPTTKSNSVLAPLSVLG
jgi:FixJ family two-component response regulator